MKTLLTLQFFAGFFLILSLVSTAASAQQNPRELFEQARMLDEGNQSLTEAIALYRRVATLATDERKLAAEAQLRVGLLYERLGRTAEAQRTFAAVLNEYTDQAEAVRQARARIAATRVEEETASDIT
ncbi:MAG: tol-pal system YbgF family protein, partial [Rhodothermales bacterium]